MTNSAKDNPFRLPQALRRLVEMSLGRNSPIRPADVIKYLRQAMFAPENIVEDARYSKVVPNEYVVEVNEDNYHRHYRPIEALVRQQWQEKLRAGLNTKNSRQGRQEYRFGGPLVIQVLPAADLPANKARVYGRINPEVQIPAETILACLELLPANRTWMLQNNITVIGRSEACDICLNIGQVQQKRLVSGQHAYIRHRAGRFYLFDGSPEGKPSTNGTYVNGRRVLPAGQELRDGDTIILAALDPRRPNPDTPGVVGLRFRAVCGQQP